MQLITHLHRAPLIGISSRSSCDRYACTLEELAQQWRKTFGRNHVTTVCTTEFRSGGNIYEGVGQTGMVTSEVSDEPRYRIDGVIPKVEHVDGILRDVRINLDLSKVRWLQIRSNIYFLAQESQWLELGGTKYFRG